MILFSAFLVQRAALYMVTIVQLFCYALLWFGVVCTLVVDHLLDCFKALPLIWDVEGFKDVREWCVVTTDPCDGGLQVEKTLLLQEANRFSVGSSFSQSGKPCRCVQTLNVWCIFGWQQRVHIKCVMLQQGCDWKGIIIQHVAQGISSIMFLMSLMITMGEALWIKLSHCYLLTFDFHPQKRLKKHTWHEHFGVWL